MPCPKADRPWWAAGLHPTCLGRGAFLPSAVWPKPCCKPTTSGCMRRDTLTRAFTLPCGDSTQTSSPSAMPSSVRPCRGGYQRVVRLDVQKPRVVLRARMGVAGLLPVDEVERILGGRLPVAGRKTGSGSTGRPSASFLPASQRGDELHLAARRRKAAHRLAADHRADPLAALCPSACRRRRCPRLWDRRRTRPSSACPQGCGSAYFS